MPKKDRKLQDPKLQQVLDAEESASQQGSELSSDGSESPNEVNSEGKIEDLIQDLGEKRSSTRLAAYKALSKLLKKSFSKSSLESIVDTVSMHLENGIKKGTTDEIVAASRTLSVVLLTMGTDGERLFKDFLPTLQQLVKDFAKTVAARAEAARSLALLTFVASPEPTDNAEVMAFLADVFTNKSNRDCVELLEAALAGWSLLATVETASTIGGSLYEKFIPVFRTLLEHDTLGVRSAAGENMALLYSFYVQTKEEASDDDEKSVSRVDVNELTSKLEDLSTDGSKHKAKKDRKQQRSIFRDILGTFEDGEVPSETMTIGSHKHEFAGWANIRRLEAVRLILESGLQEHLLANPLMHEIFALEFDVEESDLSVKNAKRAQQIIDSKAKKQSAYEHDSKQRKKKQAHIHGMIDDD